MLASMRIILMMMMMMMMMMIMNDDTETIIQVRLMACCNKYMQHKSCNEKTWKDYACSMASYKMV